MARKFGNIETQRLHDRTSGSKSPSPFGKSAAPQAEPAEDGSQSEHDHAGQEGDHSEIQDVVSEHGKAQKATVEHDGQHHHVTTHHEDGHKHVSHGHPHVGHVAAHLSHAAGSAEHEGLEDKAANALEEAGHGDSSEEPSVPTMS